MGQRGRRRQHEVHEVRTYESLISLRSIPQLTCAGACRPSDPCQKAMLAHGAFAQANAHRAAYAAENGGGG